MEERITIKFPLKNKPNLKFTFKVQNFVLITYISAYLPRFQNIF